MNQAIKDQPNYVNSSNSSSLFLREILELTFIAIIYWLTLCLGLLFTIKPEGIAYLWPANGFALAVLLLKPKRLRWKLLAVFFATSAANLWGEGYSLLSSIGFAIANMLEPALDAWVLEYFCKSKITFERIKEVIALLFVAALLNGITALFGASVSILAFHGSFIVAWVLWWASNGLGIILITPFIVSWFSRQSFSFPMFSRKTAEMILIVLILTIFAYLFFGSFNIAEKPLLREYMIFPLLIWLIFRFSSCGVSTTLLLFSIIAIWETFQGHGIFCLAGQTRIEHLISLQLFLAVVTCSGLLLSAVITGRKRMEAALKESEDRYRVLFDKANDGIFLLSTDAELLSVNEAFARMHGYSVDEMLHMNLNDLDTPVSARLAPERIRRLLNGESLTFEVEHYHKDGHIFPLEVSASLNSFGGKLFLQCMHRDITERKKAEAEHERIEKQLHQAQKMESIGQLAGGIAHDFNNMLSVIMGNTEFALMKINPSDPLHADLEEISLAAKRSAELTMQLLAFARKQTIAPKVLDLNEIVDGMLKILHRLIGEDIQLIWQPKANLWPVKIDPTQVDQILANLCINARDAISGIGKITIETGNSFFDEAYCISNPGFQPGEYVLLSVSDNGCGMDKATMALIFEPFYTTKSVGDGTGLGLSTIYGIIKQNNGFINTYSELGSGSTFKIYFPRHNTGIAKTQKEVPAKPTECGNETILLVEDDPAILIMTKSMLESRGYNVLAARTPHEAIHIAKKNAGTINLLLTDVVMPEMNGCELSKKLILLCPQIKCLFMSGYSANVITHHGMLDEGIHFIQKPFSIEDLTAKLRELLV